MSLALRAPPLLAPRAAAGACASRRVLAAAARVGSGSVRRAAPLLALRGAPRRSPPARAAAAASSSAGAPLYADEAAHLATVTAKVASCSRRLKRASWLGFWTQLSLSVVSAVIVVFSIVFKGVTKARAPHCSPSGPRHCALWARAPSHEP
jgi:hypothetical protein